ncbi:unnamed protein product [Pedinophyceae sp. YPF-701]|nr:unnamed protein product [Pedinophyceae sp. YPF-701]
MPAAAKRSRAAVEEDKPEYFEGFKVAESEHEGYESDGGMAEAFRPGAKRKSKRSKKAGGGTFESMGLCEEVMQGIKRKGYRLPTPIQRRTIPLIRLGIDVVGMARTGSGKTAAFVIPMLDRLRAHSPRAGARALLLAPTRELVLQTYKVVKELGK